MKENAVTLFAFGHSTNMGCKVNATPGTKWSDPGSGRKVLQSDRSSSVVPSKNLKLSTDVVTGSVVGAKVGGPGITGVRLRLLLLRFVKLLSFAIELLSLSALFAPGCIMACKLS
jgi:hypothetical protein